MSHSVKALPLPDKPPAFLLSRHGTALHRRVQQLKSRHPDWTPEAMQRFFFRQGLAVSLSDLCEMLPQEKHLKNMLPPRLVKARLGLWN